MKIISQRRKNLGQCFLIDSSIAERIVLESGATTGARVLEVGPGKGILTRALLDCGLMVHAVEIDEKLYIKLKKEFENNPGVNVERGDAKKFDFESIEAPYHIISNLPYSVSVMLIKIFLGNQSKISSMTLMVQKEVAERLSAMPGDKHYGSLSIYLAYHAQVDYLFTVWPESFDPIPKVDSAVIRITPVGKPPVAVKNEDQFFAFIKSAFTHRRKTLRNNLKTMWADEAMLDEALFTVCLEANLRPQNVSIEKFCGLYNEWIKTEKV